MSVYSNDQRDFSYVEMEIKAVIGQAMAVGSFMRKVREGQGQEMPNTT